MRNPVRVPLSTLTATVVFSAMALAPIRIAGQQAPPPSALVNQESAAAQEAARRASPRTADEAMTFFEAEVARKTREAIDRVWDPTKPRPRSPRTPWGDPDLRGYWMVESYTPMQRPNSVTKAFYTPEEAIQAFARAVAEDAAVDPATVHYDWKEFGMDTWQSPVRPNLRTSLIVDPPDGRLPPMTPEGRRRLQGEERGATVPSRGQAERCITGNQGPPRTGGNDNHSEIVQLPGYVVLVTQSNHDVRIIPLDGRPHLDQNVRTWLGDSRGRWDGDTLVVETTNFHPDREWRGSSEQMHLVERLTRIDADTILYEFTVTDPATWTRPWSFESPWPRTTGEVYEWACHEQNYGLINVVKGAQIRATEFEGQSESGRR
jgi:hypothetical protein